MNKKLPLFAAVGCVSLSGVAQVLQSDYIEWPQSTQLPQYVQQWTPGSPLFEDEEFYISRVKLKPLIDRNPGLQVNPNLTDDNNKRLLFWVPVGNTNLDGVHTDALPSGRFDSEVFSLWSYVDHYGDWTSPHGWVPGGFADAAHRHGTLVSGVASIPNAALADNWLNCVQLQNGLDKEKLARFLYFHGVNGLGYNSEFYTTSTIVNGLCETHDYLYKWAAEKGIQFENVWYDGTNATGGISFDRGLGSHNQSIFGDGQNKRSSLFLNYNWNSVGLMSTSVQNAVAAGRSPFDLYTGWNMQGGQPKTGMTLLNDYPLSVGLWGAHDFNYLWSARAKNGSSADDKQRTYQINQEQWFTNGNRNPADKIDVFETSNFGPREEWFGFSNWMVARSTLGWDLTDEPFVTYFNLGNGKFFNLEGKRQNDAEWYVLGIQDYMPTWRWWWSSKFLGNEKADVPASGMAAEFTWDDAWFGGSSLNLKGSTDDEYLHLFRTRFLLRTRDVITVRYKVRSGKGNVSLALSNIGAESTIVRENRLQLLNVDDETDPEQWIEKTFTISGQLASFNGKELGMIALHFTNADDLDLLLGEVSIARDTYRTPAAPVIKTVRMLANNCKGADAKVIFEMPNTKDAGEPVYNLDVDASLFHIWAQQEGEEPVLMGASSSWAAIAYQIPLNNNGTQRMRMGVQAVSTDHKSTSDITWSEYVSLPGYVLDYSIAIDKTSIKPNESFEVSFVDPMQPSATWQLFNAAGVKVAEQTGTSLSMPEGLSEVGGYDVVAFAGDADHERRYGWFVQVSDFDKGALPQIKTLTVDGKDAADASVSVNTSARLGYTGREADGIASRGIAINQGFVGVPVGTNEIKNGTMLQGIELQPNTSFGAGAWLKLNLPKGGEGSSLFQIENRCGSWPSNNWGWCWFMLDENGKISIRFRGPSLELGYYYDNAYVTPNAWTHIAFSFEYVDSKFHFRLYVNGVEQQCYLYGEAGGGGATPTLQGPAQPIDHIWSITRGTDWLSFGGGRGSEPLYNDGIVDDLVVWDSVVTPEDVKLAMDGFVDGLPDNVMSYWSFEDEPDETNSFVAKGKVAAQASQFGLIPGENEGQSFQNPETPLYDAGCPFIPGSAFAVTTLPTWKATNMRVTESTGNDTAGEASVTFAKEADYMVTLTLSNSYGSDSKTYPVIIAGQAGIDDIAADGSITAYTVDDAVVVEFTDKGTYNVTVYNLAGSTVAAKAATVEAGQSMTINVGADGVYLVKVVKDGQAVRTFKLIKR